MTTVDYNILLVEDDAMIASGLMYALEKEGYRALHCKDLKATKEALLVEKFDLAILDMQLPDGIGFEINDKLKTEDTAIIYLTIVDDEGDFVTWVTQSNAIRKFKNQNIIETIRSEVR